MSRPSWQRHANDLEQFVNREGRLPSRDATGGDDAERSLARWLNRQRHSATLQESESGWLDRHVPNWRGRSVYHRSWTENAAAVRAYFLTHGRLPERGTSASAEQVRMSNWVQTQRHRLAVGAMPENEAEWMDTHLPIWRLRSNGNRTAILEEFIRREQRFPVEGETVGGARFSLPLWFPPSR